MSNQKTKMDDASKAGGDVYARTKPERWRVCASQVHQAHLPAQGVSQELLSVQYLNADYLIVFTRQ